MIQLWKKSIGEARLLWFGCASLLYAFCWVRVWLTSQLDMSQFQGILENIPQSWQRLSPVPIAQLIAYPTRIAVTYEEPLVYLAISMWAIARSSDCISGEIGRGTMEVLLSQPVSRSRVVLVPTSVTIMGAALLAVVAWCGTYTGIQTTSVESSESAGWQLPMLGIDIPIRPGGVQQKTTVPMRDVADPHMFWPAALNLFAFGVFLCGVGTMVSSLDRYRWRTIGLTVGFCFFQMIVEIVGTAVPSWSRVKTLTFFAAYEPIAIVSESLSDPAYAWSWIQYDTAGHWSRMGPLGLDAILIGLGLLALAIAVIVFARRDVPAPL